MFTKQSIGHGATLPRASARRNAYLIFLFIVLFIVIVVIDASSAPLNIVCDDKFPPFEYREDTKLTGFAVETVKSVLGQMGIQFVIASYPWKRAEAMVLSGEADVLFSASYQDNRADVCWYPLEHLFESVYVFFIRKQDVNTLGFNGFEDLKFHHIGVTLGYSYNELFWMFLKKTGNYTEVATDEQNLLMLSQGRCDYSIIEKDVGATLLKKMKLENKITFIPKTVIQKPYFLIFNKKRVEKTVVDQFSGELNKFKNSDAYRKMYLKFFNPDKFN